MVWRLEISPPTLLVTTRAVKSIPADHKNVLYLDALNSMSYSPLRCILLRNKVGRYGFVLIFWDGAILYFRLLETTESFLSHVLF